MRQFIEVRIDRGEPTSFAQGSGILISANDWDHSLIAQITSVSQVQNPENITIHARIEGYEIIPRAFIVEMPCELAPLSQREKKIMGHITKRWFKAASPTVLNVNLIPMPQKTKVSLDDYSRSFSREEYERIKLGETPQSMDDHWFCYWEKDQLFMYRSWTGICALQIRFELLDDTHKVAEVWYNPEYAFKFSSPSEFLKMKFDAWARETKVINS